MPTTKNQKNQDISTYIDENNEKKFFDFFMEQFLLTKRSYCHPDLFYGNY